MNPTIPLCTSIIVNPVFHAPLCPYPLPFFIDLSEILLFNIATKFQPSRSYKFNN